MRFAADKSLAHKPKACFFKLRSQRQSIEQNSPERYLRSAGCVGYFGGLGNAHEVAAIAHRIGAECEGRNQREP